MRIDPATEETARDLLGHALRGELEKFTARAQAVGGEQFAEAASLCLRVAGYIAIDVCAWQWPSQADVDEMAHALASLDDLDYDLDEADVRDFLARCALGFEPVADVFPDPAKAVAIPFLVTATMLAAYRPKASHWWDYLDLIEQSLETAAPLPEAVVPAIVLLARRNRAMKRQEQAEATGA